MQIDAGCNRSARRSQYSSEAVPASYEIPGGGEWAKHKVVAKVAVVALTNWRLPVTCLFFNKIAGFRTNFRPYLLTYRASCHSDVIVHYPFANKKVHEGMFYIASFLVSSSHETFNSVYRWFGGGAIV